MDSEFPRVPSFELDPASCTIDRIILFADGRSASVFLETVFPHFTNCLVASADRAYPRNEALNRAVFSALLESVKLRVAVFHLGALKELAVKTDRILVMDEIVMQDFRRHPTDRALSLALTPERLAFLIESFFSQWEKMERVADVAFAYANFKEFAQEKFDWRAALLGIDQAN